MRIFLLMLVPFFLAALFNRPSAGTPEEASYKQQIEQWQKQRLERLKSDDGWLTLIGLFWLKPGKNTIGTSQSDTVIFPSNKSPKFAGGLTLNQDKVTIEVAPGVPIQHEDKPVTKLELVSDEKGDPTILTLGSINFQIIKRGPKFGVRVKDKNNPLRKNFSGLEYFPIDPKWRLTAKFIPYENKKIPIMNILGMLEDTPSPGAVEFQINGNTYRLDAISEEGTNDLFLTFKDHTSPKETYGAGRYLYAPPPGPDGTTIVDFNKAYSPPCSFTAYATCPLPPRQNQLPIRVEAGEKYLGFHPQ